MIALLSIVFSPAIFMLSFVIVLAGLGKSVGIRNFYMKTLLKVFEVSASFQSDNHNVTHVVVSVHVSFW